LNERKKNGKNCSVTHAPETNIKYFIGFYLDLETYQTVGIIGETIS
jgi:hypothetical protein